MVSILMEQGAAVASRAFRRDALRAELQSTRAEFHRLLDAASPEQWRKKSPACEWTVGEVFVHMTWALEYLPQEVLSARRARGMFNMPKRISDTMSYWYVRWLALRATPASLRRRYDRAMDESIRLLETIPEEDWTLGADFYGEGYHTVEDLFHAPAKHLAEHTAGM